MYFSTLIKQSTMSRDELALALGVSKGTIYNWGQSPPEYALSYLLVVIQLNAYKELSKCPLTKARL